MLTLTTILGEVHNYFLPGTSEKYFSDYWERYKREKQKKKTKIEISKRGNGSKIYVLKQDPSVKVIGARMKWIRDDIKIGPQTDNIKIAGLSRTVYPSDTDNNYLYHPIQFDEEFDALNVLGIVSNVLRMYKNTLKDLGEEEDFHWQWGTIPLQVYPMAGEEANAHYSRNDRALKFFYFESEGKTIRTGRSFDVVAHEMGHAILDALRPRWLDSRNPYTNALHESIGDLTAIFAILDDLDLCDSLVAHSKGDLHEHSFFNIIGEEMGTGLGLRFGLRNADTDRTLQSVSSRMHALAEVFTSAMYDILADIFDAELEKNHFEEPAIVLHRVGKALFSLFCQALMKSPQVNTTFYDMAKLMLSLEKETWKWIIMNQYFRSRQILDLTISRMHNEQTFRETLKRSSEADSKSICKFNQTYLTDLCDANE